ncbi:hypothetical protein Gbth_044_057 [Gluconobacter thailandicus F149-1 = NBRC 100600]|uniref:Uncharacterized protein n=1 Tax=Gluconobacter thailandicus NBRC 3257 TaxID=1381097 RepID=A0ABQ0IYC8_GLUTH|nr:YXWGXW repeat-containing protein [Gluconobacter thailandicus]AFV99776.1 hypothetical protein B932_0166 [Gluconobacter oxydans H24]ANQ41386.1 hypothetical protein BAR24_07895 [Gluconobacter oxydans]GAN89377.1 hypothetical protein Gbfr_005_129 [Gluconobacter frateurii M-2]KXV53605.1 hypothetical protein AD946_06895 [Gluconobacter thailandicus]GAC88500.1 hypothetical protein NBRC3255_2161 [Gluconobacter thailandicus NBRC 3255]
MLKYLSGLLAVSAFFAAIMALPPVSGTAHAQFVPYEGPYRQMPPPPPHPRREPVPPYRYGMRWERGHWQWVGNGYRWIPGHMVRIRPVRPQPAPFYPR